MEVCFLCLDSLATARKRLDIFSHEGYDLDISGIIAKHFWLRPNKEEHDGQQVCVSCWEALRDFHEFYQQVAEAHSRWDAQQEFYSTEIDPLPCEEWLKSEQDNPANKLPPVENESVFNPDVKVEVHDLDILPPLEEIEDETKIEAKPKRTKRRGRPPRAVSSKRVKVEEPAVKKNDDADSEPELPFSMLMNVDYKTVVNVDPTQPSKVIENDQEQTSNGTGEPQKKRRGRPRKIREPEVSVVAPEELPQENHVSSKLEIERHDEIHSGDDGGAFPDADEPPSFDGGAASGTEDSAESSSDSDSDSSYTWPAIEPTERYAHIPKRVVVKPKKYRKRPKPLIPPKRMTREELDAKKAQQAEYDEVILKFFGKFSCPKCRLLVQNFAEMFQHFRASHGTEPGYMSCCGRKFHLRKALAEHIYVHWNPEHFKCGTCGKVLQESRALEIHEQSHINPPEIKEKKMFQCEKCPKEFTTKAALEYHALAKHVPKSEFSFECSECNKKLPTKRKLKDHMRIAHDPESLIICDKCGKQVRNQSTLKKHHQLEHSNVPRPVPVPIQCEICGTWLRHESGLRQHMRRIHEEAGGEHRCHICNKISTNARALKRHIYYNHECERKFKCNLCEKAFKRGQDLREHKSTHTGEVLYTCPNCPMTFFCNANMYKHRQRLHRAEWEIDRKKPPKYIQGLLNNAEADPDVDDVEMINTSQD